MQHPGDGHGLTEGQQRTLDAIRAMARGWSLETQAKVIYLRMVNCAQIEQRPYTDADIQAIVATLRALDEVEQVAR